MNFRPAVSLSFLFMVSLGAVLALASCGVRGKPQSPLTPAELGRGQPTFKRASEEFAFPEVPSPEANPIPTPRPTPGAY